MREQGFTHNLMQGDSKVRYFELTMWPHVRAAYNFARWLVRNNQDAEDIVQESFLKAYNALDGFRGGDSRVWMLAIVRNTSMNFLRKRKPESVEELTREPRDPAPNPESGVMERARRKEVRSAIAQLAPEFREPLILRELEELSYKEIAAVLQIPMGTVMSRLSRARNLLLAELNREVAK